MSRPFPLPTDPESGVRRARPAAYLYRAAAAHMRAVIERTTPHSAARALFGNDPVTDVVLRAASSPATTTGATWASALATTAVDDSVMAITSLSAAAGLIQRGTKLDFAGHATIKVPGRLVDANDAGSWVAEDQPARVRAQRITAGPTLQPRKLVVLVTFSREMAESSNVEAVARALVSEASALALDKSLFGTQAYDGAQTGGILNGITPITPTAGGGSVAMVGDIKALTAALVAAGAGANPVIVTSAVEAMTLKLMAGPKFDLPVLASSGIAAGTVIMVEATSFVSAFSPVPEFESSIHVALHYEDTTPQDITGGTPSPAVPVRSAFQSDVIALKMRLKASWGMRAPHVAVVNGATW